MTRELIVTDRGETKEGGRHMFTHERPSDGDGGHFDHLERKYRVSGQLG